MGGYDAKDTKGNIGKIIGSMLGVPPVVLDDDDNDSESDESTPTAQSEKTAVPRE